MRNSATHNGKDLAREIALLKVQLEELAQEEGQAAVAGISPITLSRRLRLWAANA